MEMLTSSERFEVGQFKAIANTQQDEQRAEYEEKPFELPRPQIKRLPPASRQHSSL
jgi:hypothetical protein